MNIGILALQGDVIEHSRIIEKIGARPIDVRLPEDLQHCDALIMPGGESTTIGKLMVQYKLDSAIKAFHKRRKPLYGTCAGAILLAKDIIESNQPRLSLADISIARNDYGRQIDSFEEDIAIKGFTRTFNAVFIRSPVIKSVGDNVEVLAAYGKSPVLVRQGTILISTFHPELTGDTRVHKLFLGMAE
ncbi:TPA: pyridoxal 5'-phosphate synthase glutaminase subunit PdxT [Candidatus Woesearchaeota archaeon]|nr:pyridoxal 5'-phosphate synthase glutaminase subunit PdxT [Candidatus Woesearchaeota archaeon]